MVQGTSSHVGKSLLVAGLCRLWARRGLKVAPFKAQNMSLNAFVTPDGKEIGRAQALQAQAAFLAPEVDMNPILLKPKGQGRVEVVVLGQVAGEMEAGRYWAHGLEHAWAAVRGALDRLASRHDLVLVEGAGSPAELNLRERDLANMRLASAYQIPVLLVGDIERGGVFASLLGTLGLLPPRERKLVRGLIVNKFHGDPALFADGARLLHAESGVPVLGVVPYFQHGLPEEDAMGLPRQNRADGAAWDLDVAVLALPTLSNFTDFDPLARTPGVRLRFVGRPADLGQPDAIVVPGAKNAFADLAFLRASGLADAVLAARRCGAGVVGVCGGLQLLGEWLEDPEGAEAGQAGSERGLGLLPVRTRYRHAKETHQVQARVSAPWPGLAGHTVRGYEIHRGEATLSPPAVPLLTIVERSGAPARAPDGAYLGPDLFGTHLHGLFDDPPLRRAFVNHLRRQRGLAELPEAAFAPAGEALSQALDRWADHIARHLDLPALSRLAGLA